MGQGAAQGLVDAINIGAGCAFVGKQGVPIVRVNTGDADFLKGSHIWKQGVTAVVASAAGGVILIFL